jgi:hypothetical protein
MIPEVNRSDDDDDDDDNCASRNRSPDVVNLFYDCSIKIHACVL